MKIYLGVDYSGNVIVGSEEFQYEGMDLQWKDSSYSEKACVYIGKFPFDVQKYIIETTNFHNAKIGMLACIEI